MNPVSFYDIHCHALTLSHPGFLSFLETVRSRKMETLYAQVSSPNYLVSALLLKGGERIRNMLAVMENDVGSIFALMEDDLSGSYAKEGDPPPLIAGGSLDLGFRSFGRLVLAPLVMDFGNRGFTLPDTYYNRPPAKPVEAQARDVLLGIRDYRRSRPAGFLEIRPFLGINTANHTLPSLDALLGEAFGGYRRGAEAAADSFRGMDAYDGSRSFGDGSSFAGVKVYPPLGFDPWPDAGPEREKVELLYSFCERHDIPVTSHCDDQGFRCIPLEDAWRFTSPLRWRKVLLAHPGLRLDLAHFGAQYSRPIGRQAESPWSGQIVRLMADFPQVYTDISFNGSDAEYYTSLVELLERLDPGLRKLAGDRIMFGSDFVVNLSKVRSYADYYRGFSQSPLSSELKFRFCHDNPERFLTGTGS